MTATTLTFEDAMLFAIGRCARRTGMIGVTCHLSVVDAETDNLTSESRFCAGHQYEEKADG